MSHNCIELFKFSLSVCWEFLSIQVHKPGNFGFTNRDTHSTSLAQFLNRLERFPKRWYVQRPGALASVVTLQPRQEDLLLYLRIILNDASISLFKTGFSEPTLNSRLNLSTNDSILTVKNTLYLWRKNTGNGTWFGYGYRNRSIMIFIVSLCLKRLLVNEC